MIVYVAKNISNGMCYVGMTRGNLERRKNAHFSAANSKGFKSCFTEALEEYGSIYFEWEVLDLYDDELEMMKGERFWIEKLNSVYPNGYNKETGGAFGYSMHEDSKRKISESKKGKRQNSLVVERRKESVRLMFEKRLFETGCKRSPETIKRLKNARVGIFVDGDGPGKKPVVCIETGEQFISCAQASLRTGISSSSIGSCCSGRLKSAGKKHWRWSNEPENNDRA